MPAARGHHLNANVELTGYRPMRLAELATTARALLAGEVEPRRTTAHMVAKVLGRATPATHWSS